MYQASSSVVERRVSLAVGRDDNGIWREEEGSISWTSNLVIHEEASREASREISWIHEASREFMKLREVQKVSDNLAPKPPAARSWRSAQVRF
jgi:hypothetical protein